MSRLQDIRRHGVNPRVIVSAILLLVLPPALLVATAWAFQRWSGESLHALLCLMLAPFVIAAHVYAMWQLLAESMILRQSRMRLMQFAAVFACATTDLLACIAVATWLM